MGLKLSYNMKSSTCGNNYFAVTLVIGLSVIYISTVKAELRLVHVLFRHGDRTPDNNGYEMYPNDPYLHYDFYPMGLGQLSNNGKSREYKLGEILRERYRSFLGKVFTPESATGLSSDYDRTKASLQLVLAGLFPPARIQRWNQRLNWQPIPTNYLQSIDDHIFYADECPLYLYEYNKLINSPEGQKKIAPYSDFMKQLTSWTGKNITTVLDMFYLYHTLMAESSLGLTLPEWTNGIFPYGKLWNGTVLAYELGNYTPQLRRLYGGPFLRLITENMVALRNGTLQNARKMYLYSGHETNIASVLNALQLYEPHVPEYSSGIMFELHQVNKVYYIKILYYLGIPPVVTELRMPGCEVLCPLDKFLRLTADVMPTDEELICDKTLTNEYAGYRAPDSMARITYSLIRTAKAIGNE